MASRIQSLRARARCLRHLCARRQPPGRLDHHHAARADAVAAQHAHAARQARAGGPRDPARAVLFEEADPRSLSERRALRPQRRGRRRRESGLFQQAGREPDLARGADARGHPAGSRPPVAPASLAVHQPPPDRVARPSLCALAARSSVRRGAQAALRVADDDQALVGLAVRSAAGGRAGAEGTPHRRYQQRSQARHDARSRSPATLERQIARYVARGSTSGIRNASAILVDTRDMGVKALVGSADYFDKSLQGQVNGTLARRSPGSTLKPFIYALGFDQGVLHPQTVLRDVPTSFGPYTPENFDGRFLGPITATDALNRRPQHPRRLGRGAIALARSLPIPAGGRDRPYGERAALRAGAGAGRRARSACRSWQVSTRCSSIAAS